MIRSVVWDAFRVLNVYGKTCMIRHDRANKGRLTIDAERVEFIKCL